MNKKLIWIVVILVIAIIIFAKCFSNHTEEKEFKPLDKNIGDEFTELSYPNKMFIVNYEIADVTGDAEKDMIMLIGESKDGNGIADGVINNMDIVVFDPVNKKFIKADSRKLIGKNCKIIVNDYNGNQVLDIMLLCTNDNKNVMRIYTYEGEELKEIWKDRNNKGIVFSGELLDGFKIKVINKKLNFEKVLDVSDQKESYISNAIYDNSGKLISSNKKISTSGFESVESVKLNDRNGIRTIQKIYGSDDKDILDEIVVVWKYADGKWQMVEVKGLKLGNMLY